MKSVRALKAGPQVEFAETISLPLTAAAPPRQLHRCRRPPPPLLVPSKRSSRGARLHRAAPELGWRAILSESAGVWASACQRCRVQPLRHAGRDPLPIRGKGSFVLGIVLFFRFFFPPVFPVPIFWSQADRRGGVAPGLAFTISRVLKLCLYLGFPQVEFARCLGFVSRAR